MVFSQKQTKVVMHCKESNVDLLFSHWKINLVFTQIGDFFFKFSLCKLIVILSILFEFKDGGMYFKYNVTSKISELPKIISNFLLQDWFFLIFCWFTYPYPRKKYIDKQIYACLILTGKSEDTYKSNDRGKKGHSVETSTQRPGSLNGAVDYTNGNRNYCLPYNEKHIATDSESTSRSASH